MGFHSCKFGAFLPSMQYAKVHQGYGGCRVCRALSRLTEACGEYSWIHPYFDDYFENIEIMDAWLYIIKKVTPKPERARKLIQDCLLDQIKTIEADKVAIMHRIGRLHNLAARCVLKNPERAKKILDYTGIL
jgi:hypothetical protein